MPITITADSHTDHALTPAQLAWALDQAPPPCPFFIREVTLPEALGTVPSALRGPVAGDPPIGAADVVYAERGNRTGLSRMTALPPIASRKVTIIGGMHEGAYILFTAHGGPNAPREVFECERLYDKGEMTLDALSDARNFWAMHALSIEASYGSINNDLVETFSSKEECTGIMARLMGKSILPAGIDGNDPRVKQIVAWCQENAEAT